MQIAYYMTLTTHTSCMSTLDDMMSIRSYPRKEGHDLDFKISLWYSILLNVCYQQFNVFGESNKHTNGLLLDIDYFCTSCMSTLDDMMSIRL